MSGLMIFRRPGEWRVPAQAVGAGVDDAGDPFRPAVGPVDYVGVAHGVMLPGE
jgi:hypothetical protein